ncbi:MAG: helix-hairpin-helix domain-containing protein [Anaeroplasmataceae bacterium]|nr:helix-hairpin-helix domain-containing protein [Anaeroplasmataceae bacterium]
MYRKKEFILVGVGLLVLVIVGIIFNLNKRKESISQVEDIVDAKEYIEIHVEGEISKPITLTYYQPISYGVLFMHIRVFLNEYSNLKEFDLNEIINESITVSIPTLDKGNHYQEKDDVIHINQASKKELMNLYQIGDKRSDKILEYRAQNGVIQSWDILWEIVSIKNDEIKRTIQKQAVL